MKTYFTAEKLAAAMKEIIGHTGDLNIIVDGKRVESITVNDDNELELTLAEVQKEVFEIVRDQDERFSQFIIVKGDGVEVTYFERYRVGSPAIRRCSAKVGDYTFREYEGKWKKNGRGSMKNADAMQETLDQADLFIMNSGKWFDHS